MLQGKRLIGEGGKPMNNWEEIVLVVLALGMTVFIQLRVSKMRSSILGLVLPFMFLLITVCILGADLQRIRTGVEETRTSITAFQNFACYNIPTILLLCIYNYYQRSRLTRRR